MLDRAKLPCWQCQAEEAPDARHWLGTASDEDYEGQHSPNGWPLMCCKVRVVAQMAPKDLAVKRATAPGWEP